MKNKYFSMNNSKHKKKKGKEKKKRSKIGKKFKKKNKTHRIFIWKTNKKKASILSGKTQRDPINFLFLSQHWKARIDFGFKSERVIAKTHKHTTKQPYAIRPTTWMITWLRFGGA